MLICTLLAREQFVLARKLPGPKHPDPQRHETFDQMIEYLDHYGNSYGYSDGHVVYMAGESRPQDAGRYFNLSWYQLGGVDSCPECCPPGSRGAYIRCTVCHGSGRIHKYMFNGALVYFESDGTWSTHT